MAIPDYQSCMLPLLQFTSDGHEHSFQSALEHLAAHFALSPTEREELLPSGRQPVFENRVGWAKTYMKKAGLLEYPRRAYIKITDRGEEVLADKPQRIDNRVLRRYPEFLEFQARQNNIEEIDVGPDATDDRTPEESIEHAYAQIREALASEVLSKIKTCSPSFFERLVVDLLVAMGYGGSRRDAGRAVGSSGDGGIDGIINEDRLGLDIVYVQAKRWGNPVGRPEIQKFVGALSGNRARKGVFITTSSFTKEAVEYVSRIDNKIVLVDGKQLSDFMIDHGVGVTLQSTYEIKRIDSDYFAEE